MIEMRVDLRSIGKGVNRWNESGRGKSSLRVSSLGSPEEQDVGLRPMQLVVRPSPRLLHSQRSPLILRKNSVPGHLPVDLLGQDHVSVFIEVVSVFIGVLDFIRIVRHCMN